MHAPPHRRWRARLRCYATCSTCATCCGRCRRGRRCCTRCGARRSSGARRRRSSGAAAPALGADLWMRTPAAHARRLGLVLRQSLWYRRCCMIVSQYEHICSCWDLTGIACLDSPSPPLIWCNAGIKWLLRMRHLPAGQRSLRPQLPRCGKRQKRRTQQLQAQTVVPASAAPGGSLQLTRPPLCCSALSLSCKTALVHAAPNHMRDHTLR